MSAHKPKVPSRKNKPTQPPPRPGLPCVRQGTGDFAVAQHIAEFVILRARQASHDKTREGCIARLRREAATLREAAMMVELRADSFADENQAVRK